MTDAPLLTACLIVRDEVAHLESCLDSVSPFVDAVVVADTGSLDETPAIARARGAHVVHVDWADDFSAARNAVLAASSSPWVLSLDADERVKGDPAELRALLARTPSGPGSVLAFNVVIEQTSAENPRGLMRHRGTKLFQRALVGWRGRVHERVVYRQGEAAGAEVPGQAMPDDVLSLTHLGYESPAAFAERALRNARLSELELTDLLAAGAPGPEIARARLDLGRSLIGQLDPARGRVCLQQARDETTVGEPIWLWATDFLAWDAVRHGDGHRARELCVELESAGAPADYLLNLAAAVADTFGDHAAGDRFRALITRRVSVTAQPG